MERPGAPGRARPPADACVADGASCVHDVVWLVLVFPSGGYRWMHLLSLIQQRQETSSEVCNFWWGETISLGTGLVSHLFHAQKQHFQFCGPPQAQLFGQIDQFSQNMHQAESMLTLIAEISSPSTKNTHSGKACQDTIGIQGVVASTGMHLIMSQLVGRGCIHPGAVVLDIQPRFILMNHLTRTQGRFDLLFDWFQRMRSSQQ